MKYRRVSVDRLLEQPSGRNRLVMIPFALIAAITAVDVQEPSDVHLGPLLVIAPALTAAVAGPWLTALAGGVAVVAQVFIGVFHGGLGTANHVSQIIGLAVLSTLVVLVSLARERRNRQLSRARTVAETAQQVLLRPPPRRIGPLRVAWLYLTAEDESRIGGDLFATARAAHPSTRVIIGDVRGSGLASIGEASVVLGAFREAAHRQATLPGLVETLEDSICRNLEEVADTEYDPGEHFITALVLDLPDEGTGAEIINCGHPPPLLVRGRKVTPLYPRSAAPPLGLCDLPAATPRADPFAFEPGDLLVLYTDGVVEARSPDGDFYPLAERIASFPPGSPDALVRRVHHDLLAHTGGRQADDTALLIIERGRSHPVDGRPQPLRTAAPPPADTTPGG
ncbi:SpoIIE family protein phosphatase [Streptomyces sp. DW26H14]|uniref:SpoIIE family protein phosphatase n=1 Tax=Streptomyces sp. DW26H14 TaxID=3435395 RepID=UPI00403E2EAF